MDGGVQVPVTHPTVSARHSGMLRFVIPAGFWPESTSEIPAKNVPG